MEALGTVAAVVVGVAFVAAGVFKLIDGPAWPKQAADMGVVRHVAIIVPWVEIVIGMLVLQLFEPWVALAAVGLLVIFTVVIVRRLLDGSRPPCVLRLSVDATARGVPRRPQWCALGAGHRRSRWA